MATAVFRTSRPARCPVCGGVLTLEQRTAAAAPIDTTPPPPDFYARVRAAATVADTPIVAAPRALAYAGDQDTVPPTPDFYARVRAAAAAATA